MMHVQLKTYGAGGGTGLLYKNQHIQIIADMKRITRIVDIFIFSPVVIFCQNWRG
jgi:hypothetical protein